MAKKLSEELAEADSVDEVKRLLELYNKYILLEQMIAFNAGYQRRPVQSIDEILEFVRFLIDNESQSHERIDVLYEVLRIGEEYYRSNDFMDTKGLNEQEYWLRNASEYYDAREK